jgi:hypothetical protein
MKNRTQIEAIQRIRSEYPDMPQRTLARMITMTICPSLVPKSIREDIFRLNKIFSTNYNRIRRIDGSIR